MHHENRPRGNLVCIHHCFLRAVFLQAVPFYSLLTAPPSASLHSSRCRALHRSCLSTDFTRSSPCWVRAWRESDHKPHSPPYPIGASISFPNALIKTPALTRMIPAWAVANCMRTHSYLLGPHIPSLSPFFRPRARSPAAAWSTCKMQDKHLRIINIMWQWISFHKAEAQKGCSCAGTASE